MTEFTYDDYDQAIPDWTPLHKRTHCTKITPGQDNLVLRWRHSICKECVIDFYVQGKAAVIYICKNRKCYNGLDDMSPKGIAELSHHCYREFQWRYFAISIMCHIVEEAVADFRPLITEHPLYTYAVNNRPRLDLKLGKTMACVYQWEDKIHLVCYDSRIHPGSEEITRYMQTKFGPLELSDPDVIAKFRTQFMIHFRQDDVIAQIQKQKDSAQRQIKNLQAKISLYQSQQDNLNGK